VLLSVIDSLLTAIVDSGLDLSPLVCANTLYGLQVRKEVSANFAVMQCVFPLLVFVRILESYLWLLHLTELSSPTLPTELQHRR
jgi:hypothetical protein